MTGPRAAARATPLEPSAVDETRTCEPFASRRTSRTRSSGGAAYEKPPPFAALGQPYGSRLYHPASPNHEFPIETPRTFSPGMSAAVRSCVVKSMRCL